MKTMVEKFDNLSTNVILFMIIFFIPTMFISATPACKQIDQISLWSSFMPSSPLNWSSNDCCKWEGITCDTAGRVIHIWLPSKGLKLQGVFPSPSLGNLTHLTLLNLSHNSLYGSLDQTGFFSSLSHLQILDLSYNFLFGELPLSLPAIRRLDLSSNHFRGSVPSSFFQHAWNLTSFNISNNTFSGSIPSSICLHPNPLIQLLDFSFNNFDGSIPHGLGKCSKLRILRVGHNNISGIFPNDIYSATKLEEISLPQNSLYGNISENIVNLTTLKILDLSSNGFSGILPISIGKLSNLRLLLLQFNNIKGSLSLSLMNCTNLIELNLGFNNLEGNFSVLNFSKLGQLTKLDLWDNKLISGIIPRSLYSCKSLKAIRIAQTNIEGEVHPDILLLKSLSFLSLGYNRLTNLTGAMKILMHCESLVFLALPGSFVGEEMPDNLGMVDFHGFQNLRFLSLANCELTGHIPAYLSKFEKLEFLYLGNNRMTGTIPSWLGNLPRLYSIDLSSNLLSGEFPKELCRLPRLISEGTAAQFEDDDLELPIYSFKGAFVLQYKWFYFPIAISMSNNTISGSIPVEIGQLKLLHYLGLSNNNLSGNIPEQISNLKNLEQLDLSLNHLSGKIPLSFTRLTYLNFFNVSYNNLEGSIPASTQLQSFNASAFEGNADLCGAPLPNKCLPVEDKDADNRNSRDDVENDDDSEVPWLYVFVALGFIVGFWGVCGPLVLNKKWRYAYFSFVDVCMYKLQRRLGTLY